MQNRQTLSILVLRLIHEYLSFITLILLLFLPFISHYDEKYKAHVWYRLFILSIGRFHTVFERPRIPATMVTLTSL